MKRILLVTGTGTGASTQDALRPALNAGEANVSVIAYLSNHYLIKINYGNNNPAQDNRTIADIDEANQTIDNTTLPNGVRNRIVTWLNNNGFANRVSEFNTNIITYKQLVFFLIRIANREIDEQTLLSGYRTN